MRKKVIIIFYIILIFLLNCSTSYATQYNKEQYSITLPSSYTETSTDVYYDNNGNSIAFVFVETPDNFLNSSIYTKKNLNTLAEETKKSLSDKEKLEEITKETFSSNNISFTEKDINEIVNSTTFTINNQEITKFTSNNYKCFHLSCIMKSDTTNKLIVNNNIYMENYTVISKNYTCIITISNSDESYFNSNELAQIVNSITLKNYKEIENRGYFISGIIALCIIGVPSIKQLRKKEKTINIDKTEKYDDTAVTKLVEKLEEENKENQEQTNTSTWHEYLERTFPNQGTRTNMQDILVQNAPAIETENNNQDINKIEENPLPVANNIEQKVPPTPSLKKEKKKVNSKTIYIILLIIETILLAVFRSRNLYSKNKNRRRNKLFTIKSRFTRNKRKSSKKRCQIL